jgi:hypothetical protein
MANVELRMANGFVPPLCWQFKRGMRAIAIAEKSPGTRIGGNRWAAWRMDRWVARHWWSIIRGDTVVLTDSHDNMIETAEETHP